jgi:uncharacterized protein
MQIHKTGELFLVKGRIQGRVVLDCGRCTERFECKLQGRFSLAYTRELPEIAESEEDGVELSAQDMGLILFDGETIVLDEMIQEQVVMAFPYRPLCNETCLGLCGRCGRNLNTGPCSCGAEQAENPFAVLKKLKLDR